MIMICAGAFAQNKGQEKIVTFKFVPGEDMFYIPWEGNDVQLNALYGFIDQHRAEIANGTMPVYVDSYSASMKSAERNRELAFIRANRVKSELITHKGLVEGNFITKNHATAYEGHKDMVVVTLHVTKVEKFELSDFEDNTSIMEVEKKEEDIVEEEAPFVVERPEPVIPEPVAPAKPYCFSVRTNLLYDAFLLPTLGVEWRVSPSVGVKLDGSRSWWGDSRGKVQKIWLVSPEVRWYMGDTKRFYVGASANFGEYNIYKHMIGGLFSSNTGYQGKLWNAGATVGYQLYLSRSFSLDFNLGLGYTKFEYDSFFMAGDTRVFKDRDKTKNFWGPTQAGVNLIWTIGGNKK